MNIHLDQILWDDTVPFVFPISTGQVIKVYDGDTITVAAYMPYIHESPLFRFSVRLIGIDTPEIKGRSKEEKQVAKDVRDILSDELLHRVVILKNVQTDKYGRILADVYLEDLHVNKWLIDKKHAVKYDGGKKQEFQIQPCI